MKNIDLLPLWVYVLCTVSCVKDSDYVINDGIRPDDIIAISSITPVEAFADSSTEILVRVKINAYSSANREITLTTTQGIINYKSQSEALTTNMDKYVDFNLKTGQVAGPVFLRVSVLDDYIRDTVISFLKAYPDSISINPEKFVMEKNTSLPLEINLFRYKGYSSKGQNIFYSATDSNGQKVGTVIPDGVFIPGNILNAVFIPNAGFAGNAFIVATILKEDGAKKESTIIVEVK